MATFLSANIVQQAPPEGGATTRRRLLGGSAALAGAGALATVPSLAQAAAKATAANPDAELLALCDQAAAAQREIKRLDAEGCSCGLGYGHPLVVAEEAALGRELDAFWSAIPRIITLPARTPRGLMAKAACLRDVVERLDGCDLDDPDLQGMISSLTADILGEARRVV